LETDRSPPNLDVHETFEFPEREISDELEYIHDYIGIPSVSQGGAQEAKVYQVNALTTPSWYLRAQVEGQIVSLLVDSGSEVTVLTEDIYNQIPQEQRPTLQSSRAQIRGVGGKQFGVLGAAEITIQIGDHRWVCTTLIASIGYDGILGMNFMDENDCQLDMKTGSLVIGLYMFPLHKRDKEVANRLVTAGVVTIQPMTEVHIPVVQQGRPSVGTCLVEPCPLFVEQGGLLIGSGVVDRASIMHPLLVANVCAAPITIPEGIVVAYQTDYEELIEPSAPQTYNVRCQTHCLESKEPELSSSNVDSKQSKPLPAHLQIMLKDVKLTKAQMEQAQALLHEYRNVFAEPEGVLGHTSLVKHDINTGTNAPIKQRARRAPQKQQEIIDEELDKMLKAEVIEPSDSPWGAPVVLVRKKDGTTRFCVDYRKLNDISIKDAYPLPNIEETFDSLSGANMFCSLDLASGYWQVEMADSSKAKTAFITRNGLFQFRVMPFGLCNAPATFERLMEIVLRGLLWKRCLVYLDDIICYGRTFAETLANLGVVLQRLKDAELTLKPKKCELFKDRLLFLGFVIDGDGVRCDPDKVAAIRKWAPPTDLSELRSFVGFASYHRRFIKGFAQIANPLVRLTKKGTPFDWGSEQETAFRTLQTALITAPVLVHPNRDDPFVLDTDASATAMGGEISQVQDGLERVIAYASQTFSREEANYCTTKRELLAVIRMMEKFRHYLWGRHFTVRTDHGSLRWLSNFRDSDGMLARWLVRLAQFDFTIVHRAGVKHLNADGLSRCKQCQYDLCPGAAKDSAHPFTQELGESIESIDDDYNLTGALRQASRGGNHETNPVLLSEPVTQEEAIDTEGMLVTHIEHYSAEQLSEMQQSDSDIGPVFSLWKQSQQRPSLNDVAPLSTASKEMLARWSSISLRNGVLYLQPKQEGSAQLRLITPESLRTDILHALHDLRIAGHLGIARTIQRVRQRFYWFGLAADVARWCASCAICAGRKGKPPPKRVPMRTQGVGAPFEKIALDILDTRKLTKKNNQYVLVIYDYFSKWMDAFPLKRHTAGIVAEVLVKNFICYHGIPVRIHSDQGREFESELFRCLLQMLGVQKTRTAPYRAQSNGGVERANRTLLNMLSAFVSERGDDWDEHLPYVAMAYRSSVHAVTGCTPFVMVYGREMTLPIDLMYPTSEDFGQSPQCAPEYVEWVRRAISSAHAFARAHMMGAVVRQKRGYDIRAKERDPLEIGALVRYYYPPALQASKFARAWTGPYKVIEKCTEVDYRIQLVSNHKKVRVVHFDTLKPYEHGTHTPYNEVEDLPRVVEYIDGGDALVEDLESLWEHAVISPTFTSNDEDRTLKSNAHDDSVSQRVQRIRKSPKRYGFDD